MQTTKKIVLLLLTMQLISCATRDAPKLPELHFPAFPNPNIVSQSSNSITLTKDWYIALARYVIDVRAVQKKYEALRDIN